MKNIILCVVLLIAFVNSQSPTAFQAYFVATGNPLILGTMNGTINYDVATGQLRNDYNVATGIVSEFFDFNKKIRYLYCTSCYPQTYTSPIPSYYVTAGATSTGNTATIGGRQCNQYNINDASNPVANIWVDSSSLICQATYTVGTVIVFTMFQPVSTTALSVVPSWNCPAPQCNLMMDIVMILDESGSITPPNFVKEVQFGYAVASGYTFGPLNVGMGLIQFSGDARFTISMTYVQQSFLNAMNAVYQRGGSTCIGCGLTDALTEIQQNGRGGTVQKIFILLTDGMNNVDVSIFPNVLATVQSSNIIIFAIGVGPYVDAAEINGIATVIPGVQTSFPSIPTFSD
jgi:hypothetical protein